MDSYNIKPSSETITCEKIKFIESIRGRIQNPSNTPLSV